ncbi:hypothetical protein XENOCAPTIV_003648, partial [Xenoophorus captivus]
AEDQPPIIAEPRDTEDCGRAAGEGPGELRSCCGTEAHRWCFCGMQNTVGLESFLSSASQPGSVFLHWAGDHFQQRP